MFISLHPVLSLAKVFMLNDTQIANEQFIEDVNNILNTGEVPNLMQSDDMERIISSVSPKVSEPSFPALL